MLLLLILGSIDTAFLFNRYLVVTNAAREGARIAILPHYQAHLDEIVRYRVLEQYLRVAGLTDPRREVIITPVSLPGGDCAISVRVRYPYGFPFISGVMRLFGRPLRDGFLESSSTMRLENPAACP